MPPERPTRKPNLLFLAVLGAVLIQLAPIWMLKEQIKSGSSDFSALYSAGHIVATGHGSQLYDLDTQREAQRIFPSKFGRPPLLPFNHPPFEAPIFAALALLPYGPAFAVWLACNLTMWIGVMFLLRPYLPSLQNQFDLVLLAVSFFLPLLVALTQGQDSVMALLLFALCLVNLMHERVRLAGAMLALAMFKPQLALPALLMLALAHGQRRRLLAGFFPTCIALGLVSIAVVGWRACVAYPGVLLHYVPENPGIIDPANMPTLRGLFSVLLGKHAPLPVLYLCIAAVSLAVLAGAVTAWRTGGDHRDLLPFEFSMVVTATVLVAFHGNVHDFALLVLPGLVATDWLMRKRINTLNRALLAASTAALFVLPMIWQNRQILTCATLALFAALRSELIRNRAAGEQPLSATAPSGA